MQNFNLIKNILCRLYAEECAYNEASFDTDTYLKLINLLDELKEYIK